MEKSSEKRGFPGQMVAVEVTDMLCKDKDSIYACGGGGGGGVGVGVGVGYDDVLVVVAIYTYKQDVVLAEGVIYTCKEEVLVVVGVVEETCTCAEAMEEKVGIYACI